MAEVNTGAEPVEAAVVIDTFVERRFSQLQEEGGVVETIATPSIFSSSELAPDNYQFKNKNLVGGIAFTIGALRLAVELVVPRRIHGRR